MRHRVNGRVVEITTNPDGSIDTDALRKAAGIPQNRSLILQLPDGNNRVINDGENLQVQPEQYFVDAPSHVRGD